ncbi:MAG TPA: sulfatase [bacterium]|nr:sulfatase [bacterium]
MRRAFKALVIAWTPAACLFVLSIAGALAAGIVDIVAQRYLPAGFYRMAVIDLGGYGQNGLALGFVLGLSALATAFGVGLFFTERRAGWIAGIFSLVFMTMTLLIGQRYFTTHFPDLLPKAYATTSELAAETVLKVFLPPLAKTMVLADPTGHAGMIALLCGLIVGSAFLTALLVCVLLRRLRPAKDAETITLRKGWLWAPVVAMALVALIISAPGKANNSPFTPHIILISIDTLRVDEVGCYGAEPGNTPALDEFAKESIRFTRAYAPAPWTIPSHASLLTGLAGHHHGAVTMDSRLRPEVFTLAERCKQKGYATGAFVTSFMLSPRYGFGAGFDHYLMAPEAPAEQVVDAAVEWIQNHKYQPSFLFLHLFDPHWPYDPADRSLPGANADSFHGFVGEVLPADDTLRAQWRERYRRDIRMADKALGRFIAKVKSLQQWENAWVIVTADHGEEWWDHGFLGHAVTLHDEMLHVPLLVKKAGLNPVQTVDYPVSLADVLPTLTSRISLPGEQRFDGMDLLAKPNEERAIWAADAIWGEPRFALIRGCTKGITGYAWRFGDFAGEAPDAFFDLCNDPHEQHNLVESEEGSKFLLGLWTQVEKIDPRTGPNSTALPPNIRERLRSLGYLE